MNGPSQLSSYEDFNKNKHQGYANCSVRYSCVILRHGVPHDQSTHITFQQRSDESDRIFNFPPMVAYVHDKTRIQNQRLSEILTIESDEPSYSLNIVFSTHYIHL